MFDPSVLSQSQIRLYSEVCGFIIERDQNDFFNKFMTVDAPAGTGKTFTINQATKYLQMLGNTFTTTSFTGRACAQLSKSGIQAQTCHSILFTPLLDDNGDLIRFQKREISEIAQDVGDFIVVDESSMIPYEFHKLFDMLQIPIIYLGDSYQLPCIDNDNPDFNVMESIDAYKTSLNQNVRFSDDSGIFWLSKHLKVEDTIPRFSSHDDLRIVPKRRLKKESFFQENNFDVILTGTNATRKNMNDIVRKAKGYFSYSPETAVVGEQIIALRNDVVGGIKINNGELYIIKEALPDKLEHVTRYFVECKDDPTRKLWVRVPDECWLEEFCARKDKNGEPLQMFAFGHAMSVHKSQGSSIEHPLFIDEDVSYFVDQRRFRYTAVTRASEKLTVGMI